MSDLECAAWMLALFFAPIIGGTIGHFTPDGPAWGDIWRWIRRVRIETESAVICTRCGDPIDDGYMIGDGDGSGQRFAHPECYRQFPGAYKLRDAQNAAWLDQMLIESGREPGSMTWSEFETRLKAL